MITLHLLVDSATKEKLNQDMENLVARLGSIEEFKGCNI